MNFELLSYKGQTMKRHIELMLNAWKIVKRRYISSIARVMKSEEIYINYSDVDKFMKSLIILHDTGKGAKVYQRSIETGEPHSFRHEFLSAFYTKNILEQIFDRKIAFIGALVVMIHHEPILMGHIERIYKRELTPEVIIDNIKKFNGIAPALSDFILNSFKDNLGIEVRVPEVDSDKILQIILELSVKARCLPNSDKIRLIVGCTLLPLVLCDYKGAEEREGKIPKFSKVLEYELIW